MILSSAIRTYALYIVVVDYQVTGWLAHLETVVRKIRSASSAQRDVEIPAEQLSTV